VHPPKKERRGKETCLTTHVLHRKLPLDTRPIRRPIRWIICPFVSIESAQQLRCGAPQQLQHHRARTELRHHWARTAAPSTSNADSSSGMGRHCSSSITKRAQQFRQHRARTAALVWGATAAPASPSAHSSSINIKRGQQLRYGAPQQLQHHRARTQLRPNIWGSKNIPAIGYKP